MKLRSLNVTLAVISCGWTSHQGRVLHHWRTRASQTLAHAHGDCIYNGGGASQSQCKLAVKRMAFFRFTSRCLSDKQCFNLSVWVKLMCGGCNYGFKNKTVDNTDNLNWTLNWLELNNWIIHNWFSWTELNQHWTELNKDTVVFCRAAL